MNEDTAISDFSPSISAAYVYSLSLVRMKYIYVFVRLFSSRAMLDLRAMFC